MERTATHRAAWVDWSGITAVVACPICGTPENPRTWGVWLDYHVAMAFLGQHNREQHPIWTNKRETLTCHCGAPYWVNGLCRYHWKQKQTADAQRRLAERPVRVCEVEGCKDTQVVAHGMCGPHYRQARYYEKKASQPAKPPRPECSVEDCSKPSHSGGLCRAHYMQSIAVPKGPCHCGEPAHAKGLCRRHYEQAVYAAKKALLPPKPPKVARLCDVEDCDERHFGKGLCQKHYTRQRGLDRKRPESSLPPCHCGEPHHAKGLCQKHYLQAWNAEKKALLPAPAPARTCSVEGCTEPHAAHGYCRKHYNHFIRQQRRRDEKAAA